MINIAEALKQRAQVHPNRIAMHFPIKIQSSGAHDFKIAYRDLSYLELDRSSDELALGLRQFGMLAGTRAVVMLRPSPEFFTVMFALFKLGAVPVMVDPGIQRAALKACLARAAPQAFIGVELAQLARMLFGWGRSSITHVVTAGRRWLWGGETLESLRRMGQQRLREGEVAPMLQAPDALAAILFTSGSTGIPKGVEYLHRHFVAQVELLRQHLNIQPGTINLPSFPPFALFDPALGCTSVIPVMDPRKPAQADPRKLLSAIRQFKVNSIFGSPALLKTLVNYCEREQLPLPLGTIMSAGAPVAPELIARAYALLPKSAHIFAPYGATEALPVALIEGRELLGERRALSEAGHGICVGKPVQKVLILPISERQILDCEAQLPTGKIGEICVQGGSVTERYFAHPEQTALAKISDSAGPVHRMGDLGFFSEDGMLWYCGRKSQRVRTAGGDLYTEQVENYFNAHAAISRCALVALPGPGSTVFSEPALVFEAVLREAHALPTLTAELQKVAAQNPKTAAIKHFLHYPKSLPVDTRHNAKLQREWLANWATQQARSLSPSRS